MNAADVIGWIVRGTYYCPDCSPTNEEGDDNAIAIFGDSETDSFSHCEQCEALIPEKLTEEGMEWLLAEVDAFLVWRAGRPEVHRMWAEHAKGFGRDLIEKRVFAIWAEACKEENIEAARKNLKRKTQ